MNIFLLVIFFHFALITTAMAGRPLITDDAGVVGHDQAQLETWIYADKRSTQHWIAPTLGFQNSTEFTFTGIHGLTQMPEERGHYTYTGPILQAKHILKNMTFDWKNPGIAIAGGIVAPYGHGFIKFKNWECYSYLASTHALLNSEKLLLHLNLGIQTAHEDNHNSIVLWGAATEYQSFKGQYVFFELTNGEIFSFKSPGMAYQLGLRHDLTPHFQIDFTVGKGLTGDPILPLWSTLGIKVVEDLL